MKGKGVKLIIGIVLLIVAIVLHLLKALDPWLCLAIGVIGLIFIVVSFGGKKEMAAPVKSEAPVKKEESSVPQTPSEPVEVGSQSSEEEGPKPSV